MHLLHLPRSLLLLLSSVFLIPVNAEEAQRPLQDPFVPRQPHRVAIIGAGSAGASAAYYLEQFAANHSISSLPPLNITIFERSSYIGGRSTTVDVFGNISQPVELGASIFVSVNHNLVNAVNAFNLSIRDDDDDDGASQVLGIWNGKDFVYTQELGGSRWNGWWNTAKLFYRYGFLAPYRTQNLMRDTVGRFLKMYDAPIFPFQSLTDAVAAVGLDSITGVSGTEHLEKNGVSGLFSEELIQASTRVNYAQDLANIHGVEVMVCMATDGAMSVNGGNWQMFAEMIKASGAYLRLETEVREVRRAPEGGYIVVAAGIQQDGNIGVAEYEDTFDVVIIAAPFHHTGITFSPLLEDVPSFPDFVNLHVTLFSTPNALSSSYFNLPRSAKVPDMVLTTLAADSPKNNNGLGPHSIFSISRVRTAINPETNAREQVYKIFSSAPVNLTQLETFISGSSSSYQEVITWHHHHLWQSYPYLPPRTVFDEIRLAGDLSTSPGRGIWYTGSIESFISTMETSSLSGMNVAKLIVDELVQSKLLETV